MTFLRLPLSRRRSRVQVPSRSPFVNPEETRGFLLVGPEMWVDRKGTDPQFDPQFMGEEIDPNNRLMSLEYADGDARPKSKRRPGR